MTGPAVKPITLDPVQLGETIGEVVHNCVKLAMDPLQKRISELQARVTELEELATRPDHE